jgi:hypothetical protein
MIGGVLEYEWQYTEGYVHCQQSYEAVASCCANRDVDRIKPFTDGKEEEEDGEVEENGNNIIQAFHLKLGKAVE